ncbi:RsmB/NOP family class I SAM-dependent RNA methyltransferase [Marinovum algicola]|uniref:RsmB/NOP family class I SAM-dependent RNA methyltransferase n=1 Tax=Marinovum algicola TaxID=42444 RepID=UPI0024BA19E1|nr:RsmB/NOP family class I SAM-dependent RNA methyltransferase [Marinovum algicola]
MTPAARIQTAGELLDAVLAGQAAEQALTRWARGNRYAGSKDRAAIRDLVFDALRRKRSYAALGGAETGRGLMLGALRASETAIDEVFTGARFMPAPVTEAERAAFRSPSEDEVRDLPDWLWPEFARSLGDAAEAEARLLRERAEVFLRVNLLKSNLDTAQARLSGEGIATEPHALSPTALRVTEGARRVHLSAAYGDGLVELQDAASQAVVDALAPQPGQSLLDFCAGGGGKALAMAAQAGGPVTAHDIDPGRMRDIPARAARAGAEITVQPAPQGVFDIVLCDAPCSGSGSWRRAPEAKWRLTEDRLAELCTMQDAVLDAAAPFVAPGGWLAYATCSLLAPENSARVSAFQDRHPGWVMDFDRQFTLQDGGDGFYLALLKRG